MKVKRAYKCLPKFELAEEDFSLIPIRDEDKYTIMQWRNEQIDVLRQKEILTKEKQEWYFKNVVDKLFEQENPEQILFSFLQGDVLIGYGGLVHIDWESRNAEISFITNTQRNSNKKIFINDFENYLKILSNFSFKILDFKKLHTTFYDIPQRKYYKDCIENFGFKKEAHLKKHLFINGSLKDVLIYSNFKK